mgnify:CR=1 FL=1|tara:strand:+ start:661 stop:906 length:246 start_codon:yes stop_codon:yes gene_type:complete
MFDGLNCVAVAGGVGGVGYAGCVVNTLVADYESGLVYSVLWADAGYSAHVTHGGRVIREHASFGWFDKVRALGGASIHLDK